MSQLTNKGHQPLLLKSGLLSSVALPSTAPILAVLIGLHLKVALVMLAPELAEPYVATIDNLAIIVQIDIAAVVGVAVVLGRSTWHQRGKVLVEICKKAKKDENFSKNDSGYCRK